MGVDIAALAGRIIEDWRTGVDSVRPEELSQLSRNDAQVLAGQLMAALPLGPLGAAEARRLRRLGRALTLLDVVPTPRSVDELRGRYEAVEQELPLSVATILDELVESANEPADRGVPGPPVTRGKVMMDDGDRELSRDLPPRAVEPRSIRADISDHDDTQPLQVGTEYDLEFSVGATTAESVGLPEDIFAGTDADALILNVQLNSTDFDILAGTNKTLKVPRTGPSVDPATFKISPLHDGDCALTVSIHFQGNFVIQLTLTIPVGTAPSTIQIEATGRPIDSAVALEPRDISLIIDNTGSGFRCTAVGKISNSVDLPITVDDLTIAAEAARAALLKVVKMTDDSGQAVFQKLIDIPEEYERKALTILAEAGARLLQRMFLSQNASDDVNAVGRWLTNYATKPNLQLTVKIAAHQVPIPWPLLYLGDVSDETALDWNLFLGMRHIVEQVPFQKLDTDTGDAPEISSQPTLSVSLNLNPTIDVQMQTDLVEKHRQRWLEIQARRPSLALARRESPDEVLAALKDASNEDKLIYFYCHAEASGPDEDPDNSALIMGNQLVKSQYTLLGQLTLKAKAPMRAQPLVFLNACESASLSPRFYDGFVPYFLGRGARGIIGTEAQTPALFAIHWANGFVDRLLDGAPVGQTMLDLRRHFLDVHNNPLGLLYAMYCDADTRVTPPLSGADDPTD